MMLLGIVCSLMVSLWLVQLVRGNAAVVDVGWTFSVAFSHAWLAVHAGGDPRRSLTLATLVAVWALRLGGHLYFTRVHGGVPEEGRYRKLRQEWGQGKMLAFFVAQGVMAVALALPFLPVYRNPAPGVTLWEVLGVALFLVGCGGGALADRQLHRFKQTHSEPGLVCQVGLWGWSRHPNYFFESVLWSGWAVYALGSPGGLWALLAPGAIVYTILRVTGIPPTEEQALRSKGEAYRRYQETTSAFVPWPPRR